MSGIVIDVDTRADLANRDLKELNRNLAALVKNSTLANFNGIKTDNFKNINKDVNASIGAFRKFDSVGTKSVASVNKEASTLVSTLALVKTAVVGIGSAFLALKGVNAFNKASDDLTNIQNKLRLAVSDTDELIVRQKQLYQISRETRSVFADTTALYVDFSKALEKTGASQTKVLNVVKTIQQSAALSGSSSEAIRGAMIQLTQGIASGTLRGEELNSVLEQMKYLGQGLARELGMNAGALRKFAEEGRLTTELLLDTVDKLATKASADFAKTAFTVEAAATQLRQSISLFTGEVNQFFGSSARFAGFLLKSADAVDNFGYRLRSSAILVKRAVQNYITQFDAFSAVELVLKGLYKLEINPLDAGSKYFAYKQIKADIDSFKRGLETGEFDLGTQIALSLKIFKVDVDASSSKGLVARVADAYETVAYAAKAIFEKTIDSVRANPFTNFFYVSVQNLIRLLPVIRTPIQGIVTTVSQFFSVLKADVNAFTYDALIPLARTIEGVSELLSGFTLGDNSIERAYVKLFKSDSLKEFTENLTKLNDLRQGIKKSEFSLLGADAARNVKEFNWAVQDVLISLGIMDNQLFKIRDARLDRIIYYFKTFGSIVQRLYQDVFATTVEPILVRIGAFVRAVGTTLLDALFDTFSLSRGEELASAFFNGIESVLDKLVNFDFDFEISFDKRKVIAGIEKARDLLVAFGNFLKGFFTRSFEEISELASKSFITKFTDSVKNGLATVGNTLRRTIKRVVDAIPTDLSDFKVDLSFSLSEVTFADVSKYFVQTLDKVYTKSLEMLNKIDKRISDFAKKVKYYFWDIYDKVVGNSYWPDMVDEVVAYTSNLFKSESIVQQFVRKIGSLFNQLLTQVRGLGGEFGVAFSDVISALGEIKLSTITSEIASNLGGAIVAAFALLSSNSLVKGAAYSYYIGLFGNIIGPAVSTIGPALATAVGASAGQFAEQLLAGLLRGVNITIEALPAFLGQFLQAFVPFSDGLQSVFSASYSVLSTLFPVLGLIVENSLVTALLSAGAALAVFSSDARGFLGELAFGKTNKKGVKTDEGIVDYIKAILPSSGGVTEIFASIFDSNKLAIAAALAFSTALLDSVSLVEAATLGVPLLAFAILGKDGGAKLTRDIVTASVSSVFDVYKFMASAADKYTGSNSILSRMLGKPIELFEAFKANRAAAALQPVQDNIFADIKQMFLNLKKNTDAYVKGDLGLFDALTLTRPAANLGPNFVGPVAPEKRVDIKQSFSDLIAPLASFEIGGKTVKRIFDDMAFAAKNGIINVRSVLTSTDFKAVFLDAAGTIVTPLKAFFLSTLTLFKDGISGLLGILKNKFVLFGILTAGLATSAFAASDAASVFTVLATSSIGLAGGLAVLATALGAVGVAFRAFQKFKEGKTIFADLKDGKDLTKDVNGLTDAFQKASKQGAARQLKKDFAAFKRTDKAAVPELEAKIANLEGRKVKLALESSEIDAKATQKRIALLNQERKAKAIEDPKKREKALAAIEKAQQESDVKRRAAQTRIAQESAKVGSEIFDKNAKLSVLKDPENAASRISRFRTQRAAELRGEVEQAVADFKSNQEKINARTAQIGATASPLKAGLLSTSFYFDDLFESITNKSKKAFDRFVNAGSLAGKAIQKVFKISADSVVGLEIAADGLKDGFGKIFQGDFKGGLSLLKTSFSELKTSSAAVGSEIKTNILTGLLGSAGAAGGFSGIMDRLKTTAIAVGAAIKTRVLAPLLALALPFIKIGAIIAGIAIGVGSLALYFFGPGDTFVQNLEWVYDKVRSIFGLQAKTGGGRLIDTRKLLEDIQVGDQRVDFTAAVRNVDFTKMSETEYSVFNEAAQETRTALDNLNRIAIKTGELSAEQQKQKESAVSDMNDLLRRAPVFVDETLTGQMQRLQTELYNVDNGFFRIADRMLGFKPITDETVDNLSNTQKALNMIGNGFMRFVSLVWGVITTITSVIWTGLKAIGIAILAAILAPFVGIGAGIAAAAAGVGYLIYKAIEFFRPQWLSSISKAFGDITETIAKGFVIATTAAEKFIDDLINKFRGTPSAKDVQRNKLAAEVTGDAQKYFEFIPAELQKELVKAQAEYAVQVTRLSKLESKGARSTSENDLEAYNIELARVRRDFADAQGAFFAISGQAGELGKQTFLVKELDKALNTMAGSAKEFLELDFGKNQKDFVGTTDDLTEYNRYIGAFQVIEKDLTRTIDVESRSRLRLRQQELKAAATAFKDFSTETAKEQGQYTKLGEIFGVSADFLKFSDAFQADKVQFTEYGRKIVDLQARLGSMAKDSPQYKVLTDDLNKLRVEVSKKLIGGTWIDSLNESLRKFNVEEITVQLGLRLAAGTREALAQAAAAASTAVERASSSQVQGLSPEERNKRIQESVDATNKLANLRAQSGVDALTASTANGVNVGSQYATLFNEEIPNAVGKSIAKTNQYVKLQNDLKAKQAALKALDLTSGQPNAPRGLESTRAKLAGEIAAIEKRVEKLKDDTIFTFDSLTGSLSNVGVELNLLSFGNFAKDAQADLIRLGKTLEGIQKKITELPAEQVTGEALSKLIKAQIEASRKARAIVDSATLRSSDSITEILNDVGVTTFDNLTGAIAGTFLTAAAGLKKLKDDFKDTNFDVSKPDQLEAYVDGLKRIADKTRTLTRSSEDLSIDLSKVLSITNEVLKTGLDDMSLLELGPNFAFSFGKAAIQAKRDLEDVFRTGKTAAGVPGEAFIQSFKKIQQLGPFIGFFSDVRKTLSDVVSEGAKAGFERIRTAVPDLNFDFKDFAKIDASTRRGLSLQGAQLSLLEKAAELPNLTPALAGILNSFTGDIDDTDRVLKEFEAEFGKKLSDEFKAPIEVNNTALGTLTETINKLIAAFKGEPLPVKDPNVIEVKGERPGKGVGNVVGETYVNLDKAKNQTRNLAQSALATRTRIAAQVPGIDKEALNRVSGDSLELLKTYAADFQKFNDQMANVTEDQKPQLQKSIDDLNDAIKQITDNVNDQGIRVKEAGKSFSDAIFSGFSSGLKDLLSGKADENKSVWVTFRDNLLNNFTNIVIGSFVDGFMAPIKDAIGKEVGAIGGSIFSSGSKSASGIGGLFGKSSDMPEQLSGPVDNPESPLSGVFTALKTGFESFKTSLSEIDFTSIFSSLGEGLMGAVKGLGTMLSDIDLGSLFSSIKGFFALGFASGGHVSGPGTGTSDSIPAMVSNGEFVVNAKSTKRFGPLLESINAGRFGKFAEGGFVSPAMMTLPSTQMINPASALGGPTSQQVINLTITGDISRQTKGEIYKMLPSIAEGVNSHNREKGYR
jgi:tape measure domain-containing protein